MIASIKFILQNFLAIGTIVALTTAAMGINQAASQRQAAQPSLESVQQPAE